VWLLLGTGIAAAAVVAFTRGSVRQLGQARVVGLWLLLLGLIVQVALEFIDFARGDIETVGYAILMVSYVLILGFCLSNVAIRAFRVVSIGVALNALVIGLNQGMPTRPIGSGSHGNRVFKRVEQTVKHRQTRADDLLSFLGDRILPPEPFNTLISVGDVVIAIGICQFAYDGTRRPRVRRGSGR
jgi:hypothetical protein